MKKYLTMFLCGALASVCGCNLMYFSNASATPTVTHTDDTLNCGYTAADVHTVDDPQCPIPWYAVGIQLTKDTKLPFKLKCAPCRLPNAVIDNNENNIIDNSDF